jgi:hypothetical protein
MVSLNHPIPRDSCLGVFLQLDHHVDRGGMTDSAPSGFNSYRWPNRSAAFIVARSSSVTTAGKDLPIVSALMPSS